MKERETTSLSGALGRSSEVVVHHLLELFEETFGAVDGAVVVRAPGRVNLIGDHTDYNDGFVLPITIDRDVYVAARSRGDGLVRLHSLNYQEDLEYALEAMPEFASITWKNYVAGAVEELRRGGFLKCGFDMLIYGDVPLGAGLSSSAALEVAVVFGLEAVDGFDIDPIDTVLLCQSVEHRYAGVQCGIMDQFASRLGRRGHAVFLDCRTLDHEHVPLPLAQTGLALVMADSGVTRELADSQYSERRAACERIAAVAARSDGRVTALRDVDLDLLDRISSSLEPDLLRRARHVIEENVRVERARDALKKGDFSTFGTYMNQSHDSLRDLYEVSVPELDALVATALEIDGVLGSRMTGGGFGGCTVNLVKQESVGNLRDTLVRSFSGRYGREPDVYVLKQNHQTERLFLDDPID